MNVIILFKILTADILDYPYIQCCCYICCKTKAKPHYGLVCKIRRNSGGILTRIPAFLPHFVWLARQVGGWGWWSSQGYVGGLSNYLKFKLLSQNPALGWDRQLNFKLVIYIQIMKVSYSNTLNILNPLTTHGKVLVVISLENKTRNIP